MKMGSFIGMMCSNKRDSTPYWFNCYNPFMRQFFLLAPLLLLLGCSGNTATNWTIFSSGTPEQVKAEIAKFPADQYIIRLSSALNFAMENPNPGVITVLVKAGAYPELATASLRSSSSNASPEAITALVKAGANANSRSGLRNKTLLMDVAKHRNSNPEVVSALIKGGADVNSRDTKGRTALMFAASGSINPEVVSVLLEAGADVNSMDKNNSTALMFAAYCNGNPEVVSALIKAGAELETRVKGGSSSFLISGAPVRYFDPESSREFDGATALMLAAAANLNPGVIKALVKAGANANSRNKGLTPLMYAARFSYKSEVVMALMKVTTTANAFRAVQKSEQQQLRNYLDGNVYIMKTQTYWKLREALYEED
jgi:ankyrin repeat protein